MASGRLRRLASSLADAALGNVGVSVQHAGETFRVSRRTRSAFSPCYDTEAMRLVRETVREGATVWNVGANVGQWALPLARLVGRSGEVIALEPNPIAARELRRNLRLNGH